MMETIDCAEAIRRLWAYLDDELTPARRIEMEQHLAGCAHCREIAAFHRAFLQAVHDADPPPATASLRARVLDALRAEGLRDPRRG